MITALTFTVIAGAAICAGLLALARRRPSMAVWALGMLAALSDPYLFVPLLAAAFIAGVVL